MEERHCATIPWDADCVTVMYRNCSISFKFYMCYPREMIDETCRMSQVATTEMFLPGAVSSLSGSLLMLMIVLSMILIILLIPIGERIISSTRDIE